MLSGHNTDVLHRGVLFHVQTEVGGRQGVRVVTQLFHGGNVLASEKQSCEDLTEAADRVAQLRERMLRQHRAVASRLQQGAYDHDIEQRLGASIFGAGAEPAHALPPSAPGRESGDGAVREKPLDELVLDTLVESARRRRGRGAT